MMVRSPSPSPLILLLAALSLSIFIAATPANGKGSSLPEVHVQVEKVAHSSGLSDSLHGIESRFVESHDAVMSNLDRLSKKVDKFIADPPKPKGESWLEVSSERRRKRKNTNSSVIIDGTGGDSWQPRVNTTRFKIKPKTIKKGFIPDYLSLIQESEAMDRRRRKHRNNNSSLVIDDTGSLSHTPSADLKKFNKKAKIAKKGFVQDVFAEVQESIDIDRPRRRKNNSSVIIDGTGSLSHTPKADLKKFKVKAKVAKKGFTQDILAEVDSTIAVERRRRRRKNNNSSVIIDGTGGEHFIPKVNTTKFKIKPRIEKKGFVADAFVELLAESETLADVERKHKKRSTGPVIVDGTGSLPVGAPKANLKKYAKKAKIVKKFVQDAALQPGSKSMMETHAKSCEGPSCANKQSLPVVINPASLYTPNPLEADLRKEQHSAINHLIQNANNLSIKEAHLNSAAETLKDANRIQEDFHEFKVNAINTPLIPHHLQ